jgi:chromate transporter
VHRIGRHALTDRWLWTVAVVAAVATLGGVHFAITLLFSGLCYEALARRSWVLAGVALSVAAALAVAVIGSGAAVEHGTSTTLRTVPPDPPALFVAGLRTGLLTFGGAYTAIPFLLHDSVDVGGWLTREQFLDGVALGGVLPAPLIIFSTFVGYVAGGLLGALAVTLGVFLPAFGFTLVGHETVERAIHHAALQRFLTGLAAGVVGLIAATTIQLAPACVKDPGSAAIFAVALVLLYTLRARWNVALVIALAGTAGVFLL